MAGALFLWKKSESADIIYFGKVLHDAAFDEACKYIKIHDVKEGVQDFDEEGNYLKLWR
jgi:hypothetical protein